MSFNNGYKKMSKRERNFLLKVDRESSVWKQWSLIPSTTKYSSGVICFVVYISFILTILGVMVSYNVGSGTKFLQRLFWKVNNSQILEYRYLNDWLSLRLPTRKIPINLLQCRMCEKIHCEKLSGVFTFVQKNDSPSLPANHRNI